MRNMICSMGIVVLLAACSQVNSQEAIPAEGALTQVAPETLGFDPERLARLDTYRLQRISAARCRVSSSLAKQKRSTGSCKTDASA